MNTAIIAEYNPFHKGHIFHIDTVKRELNTNIIAIMSGNFVQRGEPAILEKHLRTKAALYNGVDMVLELPVEYATASADIFAYGGCEIIKKSNIVDYVSFGSECENTNILYDIATLIKKEPEDFKILLKSNMNKGISYPLARAMTIGNYLNIDTQFLNNSNTILALEYIKNLIDTNIKVFAVKRKISQYNSKELTGEISSATAIREAIKYNNTSALLSVPQNTHSLFENIYTPDIDDYSQILHYILRTDKNLDRFADITEGIENRILSFSRGQNISELINEVKTKRYTYSKIKKALLHIILGIEKKHQSKEINYIRVLGVKRNKIHLLSELTNKAAVPVITKVAGNENLLEREIVATDIYNIYQKKSVGEEYREQMVIVD